MKDKTLASQYFANINIQDLNSEEIKKYYLIKKKINWTYLSKKTLGLKDGNISALCVDEDDIWIGTWNGGLARYTLSSGQSEVFTMGETQLIDNAIRAIEVTDNYVWVGTFYGLSIYSKANSKWKTIKKFKNIRPEVISVIKAVDNKVFVGTLGSGLFIFENGVWKHINNDAISYVLCIEQENNVLYLGTMTSGINIFNLRTNKIHNFTALNQKLPSINITMLIVDNEILWIGSYGSGLFKYNRESKEFNVFNKRTGEVADDWILCGLKSKKKYYFGTFGGGVSIFDTTKNLWKKYGLADGLRSIDIASMEASYPYVFFGTLGEGVSIINE